MVRGPRRKRTSLPGSPASHARPRQGVVEGPRDVKERRSGPPRATARYWDAGGGLSLGPAPEETPGVKEAVGAAALGPLV